MSLKVWLPLNGNLNNQGLSNINVINENAIVSTSGKIGSCYEFNGSTSRITINYLDAFKGESNPFTYCCWIYDNDNNARSIYFGDYGTTGAIGINIEKNTSNKVRFYWNGSPDKVFNAIIPNQQWVHVAITYDGKILKCYLNSVLQDSLTQTLSIKNKTSGFYGIGRDNRSDTTAFKGKMNDFRLYDECLSQKQIKEIYKTLILHYKLNNPLKIEDVSGYEHHATFTNYLTDEPNSPIYDNCIRFQAGTPYITIPTIDFSGFADNFTIAWWSNISNMNGKMAWGFKDGNRLNLYPTSSKFCCNTGDGANNPYKNGSSTIPFANYNNDWHHYVMTADGTNNKLYIDGVYKGTAQTYKGITGTQIILSGWDTSSSYKWSSGYLSDFRIYATTLSDSDIMQLAKSKAIIDNKQNLYTFELQENNYAQLDYLEATGTQYILTNIKMKNIARVEFKFQYTDISTDQGLFGWYIISGYQYYSICLRGTVSDSKFHCVFGMNRNTHEFDTSLHRVTLLPGRELWDNGNSGSSRPNTVTSSQTMPIFAIRNDNGADGFKDYSHAKLYYIKFYDNSGTLLGDFIPALDSNNIACLYDKFSQQFYYNQGTGNFTYGTIIKDIRNKFKIQKNGILNFNELDERAFTKLDYIEGNGSQPIDTGILIDGKGIWSSITLSFLSGTHSNGWRLFANNDSICNYSGYFTSINSAKSKGFWEYALAKDAPITVSTPEGATTLAEGIGTISHTAAKTEANITIKNFTGSQFGTKTTTFTSDSSLISANPIILFPQIGNPWRFYGFGISSKTGNASLIPVRRNSDGDIGIYDTMNNTYHSGNGGFTYALNGVPSEYIQLESLESTGTQWIDTGVITSENISYEAEGSIIQQTNTSDAAFCGTRDSGNNNTRFVTWWNDYFVSGSRINQSYFTNSDSSNYFTVYGQKYKLEMKNKVFSINDTVQKTFTGTVTNPNNLTFALFGLKYDASTTDSRRFKGRIYYFKIWDGDTLIRDLVPVQRKSDNVLGMYDKINNIFYTNAGTGTFKYTVAKNIKIYKDSNKIEANNFIEI